MDSLSVRLSICVSFLSFGKVQWKCGRAREGGGGGGTPQQTYKAGAPKCSEDAKIPTEVSNLFFYFQKTRYFMKKDFLF